MNTYALRLRPGDDPKAALDALAEARAWEAANVLTCVGSLRKAVLRFANQEDAVTLTGHFEIVSLTGVFSRHGGHYHIAIADGTGRTYGAHLMDGSEIYTTAEIVLAVLDDVRYTVYEEVAFGLENLGTPRAAMPGRIEHALAQVGLAELHDRSPYTLSGGQQQRMALASILVLEPAVLLLDEPTAMLDPAGSQAVFEIIHALVQTGTTVVIVEHRLEWIGRYADRVLALAEGEVVLDGAPADVLTSPLLRQIGVGWLRYTRAAHLGRTGGLWPDGRALPATLEQTVTGFQQAGVYPPTKEQFDADPR